MLEALCTVLHYFSLGMVTLQLLDDHKHSKRPVGTILAPRVSVSRYEGQRSTLNIMS